MTSLVVDWSQEFRNVLDMPFKLEDKEGEIAHQNGRPTDTHTDTHIEFVASMRLGMDPHTIFHTFPATFHSTSSPQFRVSSLTKLNSMNYE